ncbi:ead/Ea22-like family protein [Escherichia coli]|uniref:ead/Ea22-like family protein n=2 Tax=Escherichia coli TaxID=562 RepID=UPI000585AF99|nr:ead/Ea22-like family protein [Escherichia coli]EFB9372685.1 ead/Ea22-like family protein [Escherichia coli]EFM0602911.1 ead/Ea22-like family protein [Escherichia coli]EFN4980652.1 ead/Ea22-like family protein [Escherichia coli]EFO1529730.1 ead/Ea22-like family protein [Escherichia coli]EHX2453602.1 ead/Ea22-like family protein [Escherichia coli]
MSKIDYQALREAAEKATCGEWSLEYGKGRFDGDDALIHREVAGYIPICRIEGAHPESGFDEDFQMEQQANAEFIAAANPATVLALLDELERNQQYIKSRDQENEDIALTVGRLLIENGQLVADTLRHLADNEIDSDYFAITSTNENGTEIDHEMAITDYALQAAGTVDELIAALEAAEKRNAKLQSENAYIRNRYKELDLLIGKNILVMQAAIIEWQATGDAKSGLAWIYNTLFGPGELPDESEKDAQAYFNRKYAPIDEKLMELHKWFWEQSEAERAAGIHIKGGE